MEVDNIKPQKFLSSSRLSRYKKNDVYLLPKELLEKVAKLHFFHSVVCSPSLLRNKQFTSVSRLKPLSSVDTTAIKMQESFACVVAGSVFDVWANSSRIELECGTSPP